MPTAMPLAKDSAATADAVSGAQSSQATTGTPITVTLADVPTSTRPTRQTVLLAASAGVMLFASFTPVDFGPLAWLALTPLVWLATRSDKPIGIYKAALLGGLVWTVPQVQWLRLASWPMYFAWALLAFYMALYVPAFVALTRTAVFRLRFPTAIAAGVSWAGLEYLRSHLFTGFPWYLLGHTQHEWTTLIQIADLGGATLISLLVASFAGVCVSVWDGRTAAANRDDSPTRHWAALSAAGWSIAFVAALGYGQWRIASSDFTPGPRVALVQGNFPSELKHDPQRIPDIFEAHNRLTQAATAEQPDVIVWPETMYPYPIQDAADGLTDAELQAVTQTNMTVRQFENNGVSNAMQATAMRSGADLVIGVGRISADRERVQFANSAVLVDPDDGVVDSYDKIHRVPFGEYVPFAEQLPFLKFLEFLSPVKKGETPKAFPVGEARFIPLICFEDTIPHVGRNAINAVTASNESGGNEVFVNLTNDGWFKGSSEHDQHLITARFRTIETRTPMVRAVNMGVSAIIDGNGVVRTPDKFLDADNTVAAAAYEPPIESTMKDESGRYRKSLSAVVVGGVPLDPRGSVYLSIGESVAAFCFAICIVIGVFGWRSRR